MSGMGAGDGALGLLPSWLAVAWTLVFVAAAASHLRHMLRAAGQRRAWHACHVLMGVGMAFMYAPAAIDPLALSSSFWTLVFAAAGLIAAAWALGGVGRVATVVWMLTALDLGAMLLMWSGSDARTAPVLIWVVVAYLLAEGALWALDLYRRVDGSGPVLSLRVLPGSASAAGSAGSIGSVTVAQSAGALIGELDINVSMLAMSVGMAYMVAAMVIGA